MTNDRIAEPVVIEVENVLNNLKKQIRQAGIFSFWKGLTHIIAVRILNKGQRVVGDLIHELNALMIGGVIDTSLEYTATMAVSGNLNTVRSYRVVYELEANLSEIIKCRNRWLTWLSSGANLFKHFWMT